MCIAIYSLKGNDLPTKEILQNCFIANSDGCGFSYAYNGTVYTHKGFFKFNDFYNKLIECDKRYNLKERSVLLHFRIATHGATNAANCHPFALSSRVDKLSSNYTKSKYSVIHNGICSCTSSFSKKEKLSDTALFIRDYLSKIACFDGWFYNPNIVTLIEQLIDSKMAILNENGEIFATSGFHKASDGNYYSNYSYMDRNLGIYSYGYFDDWYSSYYYANEEGYEIPLMQLKPGETIYFEDGTTENYHSDYHTSYKTYVTEDCEVYVLFEDGEYDNKIPMDKLEFIGNGEIVDDFFCVSFDGTRSLKFRKDAVAVI